MSVLTKLARGKPCQIRLPGCCAGNETVVLAHFRDLSLGSGMGIKSPDWCGAWACENCHSIIDGRKALLSNPEYPNTNKLIIRFDHAMGVLRTLKALEEMGVIGIGK